LQIIRFGARSADPGSASPTEKRGAEGNDRETSIDKFTPLICPSQRFCQPLTVADINKIALWTPWYEIRAQERLDHAIQAKALPDKLSSARHLPSQGQGLHIGNPDFWQKKPLARCDGFALMARHRHTARLCAPD
jgi:hypothetical protein